MKVFKGMMAVVFMFLVLWVICCWADVLMHNDPFTGDFAYQWWNIFTFFQYI